MNHPKRSMLKSSSSAGGAGSGYFFFSSFLTSGFFSSFLASTLAAGAEPPLEAQTDTLERPLLMSWVMEQILLRFFYCSLLLGLRQLEPYRRVFQWP